MKTLEDLKKYLQKRRENKQESLEFLYGWDSEELDLLDKKFDALCEYLKVEFVDETISNGSVWGDEERFYCRKKKNK